MNENSLNDINQKLENLSRRCDSLEKVKSVYEKTIKLNKENILNIQNQLTYLRKEYTTQISQLKLYFSEKLKNIFQQNKEKGKDNNEIINSDKKSDKNDDLLPINNIYEEINKSVEKKLEKLKYDIYVYIANIQKDAKEIITNKGGSLRDRFENTLFNIFSDQNKPIERKNIKELKKLGAALIFEEKVSPFDYTKLFLDRNMKTNDKEINELSRISNAKKEEIILNEMEDLITRKIEEKDENEFIKKFREKYGILEEEFSDKQFKKEIKNNNNEILLIVAILKKLKYLK